jgi:Ca2+-binding EF-hand superfamily protein
MHVVSCMLAFSCLPAVRLRRALHARPRRAGFAGVEPCTAACARDDAAAGADAGDDLDDTDVDQMVDRADVDKDGQISYEEFVKLLMPEST